MKRWVAFIALILLIAVFLKIQRGREYAHTEASSDSSPPTIATSQKSEVSFIHSREIVGEDEISQGELDLLLHAVQVVAERIDLEGIVIDADGLRKDNMPVMFAGREKLNLTDAVGEVYRELLAEVE